MKSLHPQKFQQRPRPARFSSSDTSTRSKNHIQQATTVYHATRSVLDRRGVSDFLLLPPVPSILPPPPRPHCLDSSISYHTLEALFRLRMKSRGVDIFRPLAAASSAASIFRRGNNNPGGGIDKNYDNGTDDRGDVDIAVDDDCGPVVVDVVDACDSDEGMEEGHYYRHIIGMSAPLDSCASSGGENGTASYSSLSPPAKTHEEPSYYKIRLVSKENGRERNSNDDGGGLRIEVQLTAGDDSSVQLTPLRNRRLRIAHEDRMDEADYDDESDDAFVARLAAERQSRGGIALAAPVAFEAFEVEQESDIACDAVVVEGSPPSSYPHPWAGGGEEGRRRRQRRQKWTVTDDGTIVAMPPSPSHVSSLAAAATADAAASCHKYPSHLLVDESAHRTREAEPSSHMTCPSSSSPPELVVRSVSSCSSTSYPSSSPSHTGRRTKTPSPPPPITLASVSLESPPRMTRSFHPVSLFRDTDSERTSSYGSGSDDRSRTSRGSKRKKTRRTTTARSSSRVAGAAGAIPPSLPRAARPASPSPSCGDSRFSFLSHVLDVYVLNGLGCCRHTDGDGDVRPMSGGICA